MRCACGGEMCRVTVDYVARWGEGPYVRVTGVPAWECQRCHEQEFDGPVADVLARLVRDGAGGAAWVESLPVKAFAER